MSKWLPQKNGLTIAGIAVAIVAAVLAIGRATRGKPPRRQLSAKEDTPASQCDKPSRPRLDRGVMIGAVAAILGGIIGGWTQGYTWYYYELKRAAKETKRVSVQRALEWAASGRHYSFRGADLQGANLTEVDLGAPDDGGQGADLSYSNLRGAELSFANLRGADLSGADLQDADLLMANLRGANLISARCQGARLIDCDFRDAILFGTELANLDLAMSLFQNADIRGASLRGSNLAACDFQGADLENSDLSNARLVVANMKNANLSGCSLAGANLSSANLEGALLLDSDLRGAIIREATFLSITYSLTTKWPEDFVLPAGAREITSSVLITYTMHQGVRIWSVEPSATSCP